jgi:hypothetical protein
VNKGERLMLVAHRLKPNETEKPWEFVFTV